MSWTELNFGKHAGKSLPQVLFADPDWFFWAVDNNVFAKRPAISREAEILNTRARNIKIPAAEAGTMTVEYVVHRPTGKFSHFDLVPREREEPHDGSSPTFRSNVIDMSVPRQIAQYDKLGCRSLISSLKFHVFGSKSARITKERAEAFFSNKANFVRRLGHVLI
jgi:hypothetical protein